MKKRKIQIKKLSLQKHTIASVNANSLQGGTGGNITLLETRIVLICDTNTNLTDDTVTTVLSNVETKCITDPGFGCPSNPDGPCTTTNIPIVKTFGLC
ncbi:class I lanthipeptide [uncultured Kordia sp.]|uniref:class I lanthipeptide n=1 Tax=uncultured Kordia sp. TaxID=507699 RepID=UPI002603CB9E|nr:class I lanthipeptide [uncultured Kordia sp.]